MPQSGVISKKARLMALLCACMVVFIHACPWVSPKQTFAAKFFTSFFCAGFCRIAVPFFFCAAGYFLAKHIGEDGWWGRAVLKRVYTVLVPLLIWNVIFALWTLLRLDVILGRSSVCLSVCDVLRIFSLNPFVQPYFGVLWYLRTLFILVVYSAIINKFLSWPLVIVLWIGWGVVFPDYGPQMTPMIYTLHHGLIPLFGGACFAFGMLACKRKWCLTLTRIQSVGCLLIGLFLLLLKVWLQLSGYDMCRNVVWLMIPFLLCGVWGVIPAVDLPSCVATSAFPIYILHMFVVLMIPRIASHIPVVGSMFSTNTAHGIILVAATGIVLSFMFNVGLAKCFTKFSNIAFGGR